jgi:hypothetical protein
VSPLTLFAVVSLAAAAELVWSEDLESSDGGLQSYGDTSQWAWGVVGSGPGGSYDGELCWATRLRGFYLNDAVDYLELADLPLDGLSRPVLGFRHWYRIDAGDHGSLELQRGGGWQTVEPIYGYPQAEGYSGLQESWEQAWVDLSVIDPGGAARLVITADASAADAGWYVDQFELWDGDPVPPRIDLEGCLGDTEDDSTPYDIELEVTDDLRVRNVVVVYDVDEMGERRRALVRDAGDRWVGSIPALPLGSSVEYYFEANDGENIAVAPTEPCAFEVALPTPTDLVGPRELVWGELASLSWSAPDSDRTVLGYEVHRDGALLLDVEEALAEAPVVTGEQTFAVSAVYEEGVSDLSDPVLVQAAVPSIDALEPSQGYQGDQLRLQLGGEYLLLSQDDLEVELGEGIQIESYDVRDVDLAFLTVRVDAAAPGGMRDLSLWSGALELEVLDAFEVLEGDDRPKLTDIVPTTVRQGDELQLLITASDPFADVPSVWLGGHIVVEAVTLEDDSSVLVDIVVPYDTPLGMQEIEVDDGTRIFSGPTLLVRDYIAPVTPDRRSGTAPGRAGLLPLLAGLLALLSQMQRRRPPSTGMLTPRR